MMQPAKQAPDLASLLGETMRLPQRLLVLALLAILPPLLPAQTTGQSIHRLLDTQVAAWNRGDISAFMQGYANSPDTTFVGKTVQHGYQAVLDRYRKNFPDQAAMGRLTFTDLQIRPLGPACAVATGRFHLARSPASGGPAQGIFSLVFIRTHAGWKITLDHTD
jgi:uncharacterized protein (TIGR02246 family)